MDGMDVLAVAPACQPESGWIGCSEAGELGDQPTEWHAMTQHVMSSLDDLSSFKVDRFGVWANYQYYTELGAAARLAAAEKAAEQANTEQMAVQETEVSPLLSQEQQVQAEYVMTPPEICSPAHVQSEEQQVQDVHVTPPGQLYAPATLLSTSMQLLQIASAPPGLALRSVQFVSQELFAKPERLAEASEELSEQINEGCEPPEANVIEGEEGCQSDASVQCTPVPSEAHKRLKLSVKTPMEGVPELHGSALRDTPSHTALAVIEQCPCTHIAGVPETNRHLPVLVPDLHATAYIGQESWPLTPPSQMEGVPEIHLSAWAPPAQPRIPAEEGSVDEMNMRVELSEHDVTDHDAPDAVYLENDENAAPEQHAVRDHCAPETDATLQSPDRSNAQEGNTQPVASCLQWIDDYVERECGLGAEDDQNLWCGDEMGGHELEEECDPVLLCHARDGFESEEFPEDPLTCPPHEPQPPEHEHASVTPKQVGAKQVQAEPPTTATKSFPKGILKKSKVPGNSGESSAGPSSRKLPLDQENLPSGGNRLTTRTPHFAPLPQPNSDQHFSGGSEAHSRSISSPSEQTSQGKSGGEEGEEGSKPKKKMTRNAKSLMAKHLRRKSLALAGTKEVDGRRVSTRKKMKPLRWWCSEAKTYCRKHQSLPTVQAVIRTDQKSAQYRGFKNPAESYQMHREEWT